MRFCAQSTLCLPTILIAAKGSGIAQLRYQKRAKAISSKHFFFVVSKGATGGGGGGGSIERNVDAKSI